MDLWHVSIWLLVSFLQERGLLPGRKAHTTAEEFKSSMVRCVALEISPCWA
jgi:hypothetical protein